MDFATFQNTYLKKEVTEVPNLAPRDPLVSVLVQTYKHESYIKECIKGILDQKTSFTFEILIGEDDSRDSTREICLELAKEYPGKIRLFLHHRENQKKVLGEPTANFNAFYNFYSARGEYYAFCEGDDQWTDSNKLQTQIDFLRENPEFILTYHPYVTINSHGKLIESNEEINQPKTDIDKEELTKGVYHPLLLTLCFKKQFYDIPKEMIEVINLDTFLFSLLGNYGKAKYLDNIKPAKYRKHPGGIWSPQIREKKILSKIITYGQLKQYYLRKNKRDLYDLYRKKHLDNHKMLLVRYLRDGNFKKFLPMLITFLTIQNKKY